jgi:hypothetical protein
MFVDSKPADLWSGRSLSALVISFVALVVLSIADGLMKAYLLRHLRDSAGLTALSTWIMDFRYVSEQVMFVAAIVFVGAKFFETRTIFTVGFDKLDRAKVAIKGPDEDNVVWIGHRYQTKLEAEAVSTAMAEKLR